MESYLSIEKDIRAISAIRGLEFQICQDFLGNRVIKPQKTASDAPERQEEADFWRFSITFIFNGLPNRDIKRSGQKGQELSVFRQN